MRKLSYLLAMPLFALAACSQGEAPDAPVAAGETGKAVVTLTRANVDAFQAAGIDKVTVIIYQKVKKETSIVDEQTVSIGEGTFDVTFKLGGTYQMVAFANAASVSDKESAATLCLHLDPKSEKAVYCTPLKSFNSDKSVAEFTLELAPVVSQVTFRPVEDADALAGIAEFDEMNLKFSNTCDVYYPANANSQVFKLGLLKDYTLNVKKADNFTGSFYTFLTPKGSDNWTLNIDYMKGGAVVNTTPGELESGQIWDANYKYTVRIPLTVPDYFQTPWAGRPSLDAAPAGLIISKTQF